MRAIRVTDPRTGEEYVVEYRTNGGNDATSREFRYQTDVDTFGYYYLYDPLPGTDDSFARWIFDTPPRRRRGAGAVDSLDPQHGAQVRVSVDKATSSITAPLVQKTVAIGQVPKVAVKIKAPGASAITGQVRIYVDGKNVRTVTLTARDGGKKVVALAAFRRAGTHSVKAVYAGSAQADGSASSTSILTVRG